MHRVTVRRGHAGTVRILRRKERLGEQSPTSMPEAGPHVANTQNGQLWEKVAVHMTVGPSGAARVVW